jgi:hypothetical protein
VHAMTACGEFPAQLLRKLMDRPLTRAERNRRAMNGLPMSNPPPLIRRHDQRNPMFDLEAADEAAELELARKAQLEAKEKSRLEHGQKLEASVPAPKPGKAKPSKA